MRLFTFIVFSVSIFEVTQLALSIKEPQSHWIRLGETDIEKALKKTTIDGVAKNVILFVGDGLGPTTTTSARIYGKGESGHLAWETLDNIGVLKTYSANKLVPDSSSTATALFCGIKGNHKTSGVDASVDVNDCKASLNKSAQVDSIIDWAQKAGKATGFVTTTRVTHATPSALYAHTPNRNWECEKKMPANASNCKDIARQLIEDLPGKRINVIMGGGRQCLQSPVNNSDADPIDTWSCLSQDGRDLIRDWLEEKKKNNLSAQFISNNVELKNLKLTKEYTLGIFANGHLKTDHLRDKGPKGMPSLTNMTEKAIRLLEKNSTGYVLVVEGGLIDQTHHRGHARQALDETVGFSDAIAKAMEMTDPTETLLIVTSDHSHSLLFTGYPNRGDNILSYTKSEVDGLPFTSLIYGTGGPNNYQFTVTNGNVTRRNPSTEDTTAYSYSQQALVYTDEVTHSGTDVLVYARGPMAHLFTSVHEQTYVAYVIAYAAKIGKYGNSCAVITSSYLTMSTTIAIPILFYKMYAF